MSCPRAPPSPLALRRLEREVAGWLRELPAAQRRSLSRALRRALQKRPVSTVLRSLMQDVIVAVTERNPIAQRSDSSAALQSFELHAAALRFREKSLLSSLARRVQRRVREGLS